MPTRAAVVYSTGYECDIGPHVFPMEKFRLTRDALVEAGDVGAGEVLEPEPAPREDLLLVHTAEYLDDLAHQRWTPRTLYSELPLTAEIVRAYELAAGGTTRARASPCCICTSFAWLLRSAINSNREPPANSQVG